MGGVLGDASACALAWPLPAACGRNVCASAEARPVAWLATAHAYQLQGRVLGLRFLINASGEVMKLLFCPSVLVKKGTSFPLFIAALATGRNSGTGIAAVAGRVEVVEVVCSQGEASTALFWLRACWEF